MQTVQYVCRFKERERKGLQKMKQRGWFQTEVVSHFRALSNNTDSRCPCCLDPHISATPSGITPTLVFNSHVPFFFLNMQIMQIPSTAYLVISYSCLFPRNLSCGLPHQFSIATEKLYFPESNKLTLSTSSKKYHTPDQLS